MQYSEKWFVVLPTFYFILLYATTTFVVILVHDLKHSIVACKCPTIANVLSPFELQWH